MTTEIHIFGKKPVSDGPILLTKGETKFLQIK